jgi:hypothetical protein
MFIQVEISYNRDMGNICFKIEDDILISFDVESLFTRAPIHDTLDIVWEHITAVDLPQDLSGLIEHCVSYTFFVHQGKFF